MPEGARAARPTEQVVNVLRVELVVALRALTGVQLELGLGHEGEQVTRPRAHGAIAGDHAGEVGLNFEAHASAVTRALIRRQMGHPKSPFVVDSARARPPSVVI